MARINLLPWREELRRQQTKDFATHAGLSAVLAGLIVFYGWYHVGGLIDHQNARNQYLQQQIRVLQGELREIEELESTKEKLLARMNIIQRLQTQRPQVVHLFFELAQTLPDGVFLTGIDQVDDRITLEGFAESNARVSAYMRNLDGSDWLKQPKLEVIEAEKDERISRFKLHLKQTAPNDSESDGRGPAQATGRTRASATGKAG